MFRDRFWLTLVLTLPTLVWSEEIQHWFGYSAPVFPGAEWWWATVSTTRRRW
jgi:P-type Cu2+ transporter